MLLIREKHPNALTFTDSGTEGLSLSFMCAHMHKYMSISDNTILILVEPRDPITLIILQMQTKYLNLVGFQ